MKFKDIPKFTRAGSWQASMGWKYLIEWINENIRESDLQLNPDFQRGHVWTVEQQIAYIEFRLRGGTSGKTIYFNCPGWMNDFDGDFVCVDGLQRITAIQKFLNNEIKVFGCYYRDFEDKLPSELDMIVNVNNLKTREEVLRWYIEMNSGGVQHTEDEINRVKIMLNNTYKN